MPKQVNDPQRIVPPIPKAEQVVSPAKEDKTLMHEAMPAWREGFVPVPGGAQLAAGDLRSSILKFPAVDVPGYPFGSLGPDQRGFTQLVVKLSEAFERGQVPEAKRLELVRAGLRFLPESADDRPVCHLLNYYASCLWLVKASQTSSDPQVRQLLKAVADNPDLPRSVSDEAQRLAA